MLNRSLGMPIRRAEPPSIWDTYGISGNVFANPVASSSTPYPQEMNPWSSRREEPIHSSTVEKSEKQKPVQDQRCQSGPSARNSFDFRDGRVSLEEQKAQKQDRFLRGRQIAYLIYDYFRVVGSHDSVENDADLFTIDLRNDENQEFDSKADGILVSITKIPSDDVLETN